MEVFGRFTILLPTRFGFGPKRLVCQETISGREIIKRNFLTEFQVPRHTI